MGKASSSKKVARVAKAGGKAGHHTNRTIGYPMSVTALIVIGLAVVIFVKVNRTAADNTQPRPTVTDANGQITKTGDHFHEAIGFNVCGKWVPDLQSAGTGADGIDTLGDGIISIQPTSTSVAGKNAKLAVFLHSVDVTLSNDKLGFPAGVEVPAEGSASSTTSTTSTTATSAPKSITTHAPTTTAAPKAPTTLSAGSRCAGKPAVLRVAEWTKSFTGDGRTPTTEPPAHVYKSGFTNILLDHDLASLTVYYGPADAKIPLPKSTPNLLHLKDLGQTTPSSVPSIPGVPGGVPSPSTPGSSPESPPTSNATAPGSSSPGTSTP